MTSAQGIGLDCLARADVACCSFVITNRLRRNKRMHGLRLIVAREEGIAKFMEAFTKGRRTPGRGSQQTSEAGGRALEALWRTLKLGKAL